MTTPDSVRVEPDESPEAVETTAEELAPLYRQMLAIRRMEEAAAKAYSQGKIGGFLHLIIGQEAVCVGALAACKPEDYVVATYRDHGHAYAKGSSARAILAELYGKKTGLVKGLGGSMHLFDAKTNFLGGYGIVGGHVPIAAGAAFASKYRGDGRVTLCFFGEGASTIGGFAEGVALAALWKLPIVLICENNQYSMGTPLYRSLAVEDVSLRALAHGMARDRFDGDDVVKVKRRIAEAVERARDHQRAHLGRGRDLSVPRPLDDAIPAVSHQGRSRRVEAARSARRSRQRLVDLGMKDASDRGARERRQGRDRGRREVRRRVAGSRRIPSVRHQGVCHGGDQLSRGAQSGDARGDGARSQRLHHG